MDLKQKLSKRYTLTKLSDGWREKIFASVHSERLKLALAVLSTTGCRPSELERGVMLRLFNGNLTLGIQGAKVDVETGLPTDSVNKPAQRLQGLASAPALECNAVLRSMRGG